MTIKNKLLHMKKLFIGLSFMSFILTCFGQEEKIIVIDKGSGRTYKEKKVRPLVENNSVFKFNPLQMVVGEINFGLEKKIDEMSSVEFEFGPTLSNIGFTVNDNHYYDPFYGPNAQETSGIGFFLSAAYRFYPMDNGLVLNGFYVSPVVKYRLMNFGVQDFSETLADQKGSENHLYFTFNFGFQQWLSERFSLDYFAGIGLGYEAHVRYNVMSQYNDVTGQYEYSWDKNAYNGVRFVLTGGIKIGIGN